MHLNTRGQNGALLSAWATLYMGTSGWKWPLRRSRPYLWPKVGWWMTEGCESVDIEAGSSYYWCPRPPEKRSGS